MNNPLSVPETTTATPNQWTTYTVTNSDDIYLTDKFIYSSDGLPLGPNETYTASSTITLPSYVAGSGYLLFKTDAYNYQVESNEDDNVYAQALDIALPNLIITDVTAPTAAGAGQSITLSWTGKNDSSIAATNSYWYWYDQVVFSTNNIYGDSDDIYLTDKFIYSSDGLPLEPNETYTASSTVTLPSYVAGSGYLLFKTDASSYQTESNENDNVYAQALDIVDNPPTVLNPITDVNVDEDAANTVIDLTNVFTDIDNDIALIVKSVFVNDNPGLVTATIAGNQLTLDYQDNKFGTANITIRGTSNGKTVDDTFVITVNPVDDAPIVLNPITDVNVDEDAANTVIDLTPVFSDPDGDVITKSVLSNTNTSLVTATIVNNQLILDYLENKFGTAQITIRGTSKGLFVEDTFTITVNQVTKGILITGTSGNDNLVGGDGNDTLQGLAGNDTLNGGLGSDSLEGGNGNDVYYVDNVNDVIIDSAGTDTVIAPFSYTLAAGLENLTLTGNGNLNGTGNTLNNTIIGNNGNNYLLGDAGNDTLDGKAGVDTLDGGAGNDTYTIDNVNDVIIDSAGTDTVSASISYTLAAGLENLTLTGNGNLNGTGNSLNNTIIGNNGNNYLLGDTGNDKLDGKAGVDTLDGGAGNDTYTIDNINDVIIDSAGTDTVSASITYTLANNLENLTLTGSTAINGTGNNGNNVITGNSGANLLSGLDGNDSLNGGNGNDTLLGGNGDDTLIGGTGNDSLTGGSGRDFFRYNSRTEGIDTITDFNVLDDTILVSRSGFSGGLTVGTLLNTQFTTGTSATTSAHRFIYNASNGQLWYDIDGTGTTAASQIATLSPTLALTASNFGVF